MALPLGVALSVHLRGRTGALVFATARVSGDSAGGVHSGNAAPGVFYGEVLPQSPVDIKGERSIDSFEVVKLTREHNDANVLAIGVRFVSADEAKFAVELFLSTKFSGDERHKRRIEKF